MVDHVFVEARDREVALAVWILGAPVHMEQDCAALAAAMRGLRQTPGHPHPALVLIVDALFPPPDAAWRRRLAASGPNTLPGSLFVFVSPSTLLRGVYTALNWLRPPPYEHDAFDTVELAEKWIERRRGPVPELRALVARARNAMAGAEDAILR